MRNEEVFKSKWDVAVVGGGVIGLSIARELGRRGLSVAVLERGHCGREASFAAAGMLAPQVEAESADAFFHFGCLSRDLYPSFAKELFEETAISIELDETGTLLLAFTEEDEREAEHRRAWQQRAGFEVERLTGAEARALEPNVSPHARAALRFGHDWQVENRQLIAALIASARRYNVSLYEHTEVLALRVEKNHALGVETTRGNLFAKNLVIASGAWSSRLKVADSFFVAPTIEPVRGQMFCFKPEEVFARHVLCSPRGYIVPRRDRRLLAGATVERVGFDKSVTEAGKRFVLRNAQEIAPSLRRLPLIDSWAGLRPRGESAWPVLGATSDVDNLFYAVGHFRNGILLAPLTARIIADMITGRTDSSELTDKFVKAFSPERFQMIVA
ncbi:MAG: glycine oxidase ThiO [Pyrinomonadaceae bacterium]|nr:glycine oxidase ThiO [Pyrinomonadaceae bacterium]